MSQENKQKSEKTDDAAKKPDFSLQKVKKDSGERKTVPTPQDIEAEKNAGSDPDDVSVR